MDPAIIGSMRVGYFRIGVFRPDWDRLLTRFKNVGSDDEMLVDVTYTVVVADDSDKFHRVAVRKRVWDDVKSRFKKVG